MTDKHLCADCLRPCSGERCRACYDARRANPGLLITTHMFVGWQERAAEMAEELRVLVRRRDYLRRKIDAAETVFPGCMERTDQSERTGA